MWFLKNVQLDPRSRNQMFAPLHYSKCPPPNFWITDTGFEELWTGPQML